MSAHGLGSDVMTGVTRSYTSISDGVHEVQNARVFAGIHFRPPPTAVWRSVPMSPTGCGLIRCCRCMGKATMSTGTDTSNPS